MVSTSFEQNKYLVRSVLVGRFSKRLANRIAGYLTTLAKRMAKEKKVEEKPIEEETPAEQ